MEKKIKYTYEDGIKFIYKTSNKIHVFDLQKIIPNRFIDLVVIQIKKLIPENTNENINIFSYKRVKLVGADGSSHSYSIPTSMSFLMNSNKKKQKNEYTLDSAINIDIIDNIKSFNIFTGIMLKQINQDKLLDQLLKNTNNTHNVMYKLVEHMLDYIRVMIVGDYQIMYAGYMLLSFILIYYNKSGSTNNNIIKNFVHALPPFKDYINEINVI